MREKLGTGKDQCLFFFVFAAFLSFKEAIFWASSVSAFFFWTAEAGAGFSVALCPFVFCSRGDFMAGYYDGRV
jgi:hypothetical protein